MATMANDTFDSNIYENTNFMTKSGTNALETNEVETNYEPLRMEHGKLSKVNTVATRKGKCCKRRWWITGAVVTVLLCTGLSLITGWVAGTPWARNKLHGIKDKTDNQEITQLPDTLQEQMENVIQLKFEEIQRTMKEEKAKFDIEKAKLEDKITNMENRLQSTQNGQSATEEKCNNIDEVNIDNRLAVIESVQNKKTAAFSVYPSAGQLKLNNGNVVPFSQIIIDSMDGFDADEHHYTCPTTGTYYFSLCINLGELGGKYDGNSELYLYVGGSRIMEVYSHNSDSLNSTGKYHRDQACNAVICRCSLGSTVLAKCNLSTGCRIYGTRRSILSGFLINLE